MKNCWVMMFNLQIMWLVMFLGHAESEYIHIHIPDGIPDPHFPAIRRGVSKLTKFIIADFTEETFIVCVLHCLGNRFCVAVNFKEKTDGNEPNCQLTNTTEQVFDEDVSNKGKVWTFREVTVDRTVLDCPGEVNECQNGGTMIWDPVKPFTCRCSEGFKGERCENDINECENESTNTCGSNGNCTNTNGSYICLCHSGYIGVGKTCSDFDECMNKSNNTCHPNATCINTDGSYVCKCQSGYTGDGSTCAVLPQHSECFGYEWLTESDRNQNFSNACENANKCDTGLTTGWYRFGGAAGNKMPTSCVPRCRCGTHATGWLNGTHPTVVDGKVTRTACYSWENGCCEFSNTIEVVNCGQYYAYKLSPPSHCHIRYCGSDV